MAWNIIVDSSCDLMNSETESQEIQFTSVPFVIRVSGRDYIDDAGLDVSELMDEMRKSDLPSHTSCPAPEEWLRQFEKPGDSIAITISSALSGSYNSAYCAREMLLEESSDKRIGIVDSRSTGPAIVMAVRRLIRSIQTGMNFNDTMDDLNRYIKKTRTVFALSSFDNLVKSGRMCKLKGVLASKLGMIGIGVGSEKGTISIKGIVRGQIKAVQTILSDMAERGGPGNEVVISHCQNAKFAERVKAAIINRWDNVKVTVFNTRGLNSYYAEAGGIIVAY